MKKTTIKNYTKHSREVTAGDAPNVHEFEGDELIVSDGYHTFNELYAYRKAYNAILFNEWAARGRNDVHKSRYHSDGEACFGGGWFIVMADLPTGQISNHYEEKDWDLFDCQIRDRAEKWDGHTPQDVASRLRGLLTPEPPTSPKEK